MGLLLAGKRTRWLLLLDNADEAMARSIFKPLPQYGRSIILSTREHIPSSKAVVVNIHNMEEDEAFSLLLGVPANALDEQESDRLMEAREVAKVDYMPLAINLARVYVENMHISFRQYLIMFKEEKRGSLLSYTGDDSDQYKRTIQTVWQISFERLRRLNPTAVRILEVCSFLEPGSIPMRILERE